MSTIWKYALEDKINHLDLPQSAQILDVQLQGDIPTLWALVDETAPTERRVIVGIGTGETITGSLDLLSHISTVQTEGGFVWHICEVTA